MRTFASDLRAGDLIHLEESSADLWRVNSNLVSRQAQGRPFAQLDLRETKRGTKKDVRLRTDDMVEKAELEPPARLQVLYSDAATVTVMDGLTYEQQELPLALLGYGARFVQDGMELVVEKYKGAVERIVMPAKVEAEVASVEEMGADSGKMGRDISGVLVNVRGRRARAHVHGCASRGTLTPAPPAHPAGREDKGP